MLNNRGSEIQAAGNMGIAAASINNISEGISWDVQPGEPKRVVQYSVPGDPKRYDASEVVFISSRGRIFDTNDPRSPGNLDYTYLGTDGAVAVRAPINPKSDMLAEAFDLTTCDMVWSIPRIPGSLGRVARIGNTLVRVSDDGNAIYSLVRP